MKKKDRLECEQATLDDDTCTALDCFAAEQYKQKASLDECSAGLLERVAQLPQGQRLVINEVFLKGKSQRGGGDGAGNYKPKCVLLKKGCA